MAGEESQLNDNRHNGDGDREIVPLPRREPIPEEMRSPPPRRLGLHGFATAGMALCAVVAIVAGLAFLTIGWPGRSGRIVIAIGVGAVLGFLTCMSAAVFTAARDTYARPDSRDEGSSH
jgi:hypothetical protein